MKLSLLTCLAWLLFSVHSMASNTDSAFIQHASTEVLQANTIVKADENPDETIEAKNRNRSSLSCSTISTMLTKKR